MGGWDSYCLLAGTRYMYSESEIRDEIVRIIGDLSRTLRKGLMYSLEDIQWWEKYMIICPYQLRDDGTRKLLANVDDPEPETCTPDSITTVFNVVPGDDPQLGDYVNETPEKGDDGNYDVSCISPVVLITHGAYRLLLQAAPSLQPHILYRLATQNGRKIIRDLDYGPINGVTGEQYVFWPGMCRNRDGVHPGWGEAHAVWLDITEGKSDEEILHEAWRGRGSLWAMVRPDRFPVSETSSANLPVYTPETVQAKAEASHLLELPLELLILVCENLYPPSLHSLMSTCKTIYSRLVSQVDHIVQTHIRLHEPWYLPAGPFDIPNGSEEIDWWNQQWSTKLNLEGSEVDFDRKIPWFQYRRACSHSMSMWSRIRIWRVIKQLDAKAEQMGYL